MNQNKVGIVFFLFLEINLILWVVVGYSFIPSDMNGSNFKFSLVAYVAIAGFLLAAWLQHWAYYNIYKPIKIKRNE